MRRSEWVILFICAVFFCINLTNRGKQKPISENKQMIRILEVKSISAQ